MAKRIVRINGYPIDLARSEEIRYPSKITPHPAESGTDFVDHIKNDGIEISLECLVSDSPIGEIATDPTRQNLQGSKPSEDAHARLVAIREARVPIVVECSKGTFENMGMLDLTEPANSTTTGGLTFTIKLLQIVVKSNKRTLVRTATRLANGQVDQGIVLDRLRDGQTTLWRKGKPAGKPTIIGSEIVFVKGGKILHADQKTQLTDKEFRAFSKDLARDSEGTMTVSEREAEKSKAKEINASETLKRQESYLNAQEANPGKKVDPALFGLTGKPKAFDPNTVPKDSALRSPLRTEPL